MTIRVPLPNREQLRTLTGLIQALKFNLNVASNQVITDDSALGYVNAAEDIDLIPLKSFFMKRTQYFEVATDGTYRINSLDFAATEIIGVFYEFDNSYRQKEWLQYVDPQTFGKGYGTVYTDALFTVDIAMDGTNDQLVRVYPAPPSARVGIEYYYDWAKLGDLTTNCRLNVVELTMTGTATSSGTFYIGSETAPSTNTARPLRIDYTVGDTAESIISAIMASPFMAIPFQDSPGNNVNYWTLQQSSPTTIVCSAPEYIEDTVSLYFSPAEQPSGLVITGTPLQLPFIQRVHTNWLLTQFPYLYYYAALKHAYSGLYDPERYQLAEKEYLKAVQVFQSFTDRAEWGGVMRQSDYCQNVIW